MVVRLKSRYWFRMNASQEDRIAEPGNPPFTSRMTSYLGREANVRSVHCDGSAPFVYLDFMRPGTPFDDKPSYQFGMNCIQTIVVPDYKQTDSEK